MTKSKVDTKRLVLGGVLSAMVILLQLMANTLPTVPCLVLIPIAIGAMLLGPKMGAFLGFLFGVVVLVWCGIMGREPFTAFLFQQRPLITSLICLLKGVAAGLVPAIVYRALCEKKPRGAVILAAALAPICNTGIFAIGMLIIMDTLNSYLASQSLTALYFFLAVILINFTIELVINLVAAPAIYRALRAFTKKKT